MTPPENDGSSAVGSEVLRSPRPKSKAASSVRQLEHLADGENGEDIRSDIQEHPSELGRTIPIHTTGIVSSAPYIPSVSPSTPRTSPSTSPVLTTRQAPSSNPLAPLLAISAPSRGRALTDGMLLYVLNFPCYRLLETTPTLL